MAVGKSHSKLPVNIEWNDLQFLQENSERHFLLTIVSSIGGCQGHMSPKAALKNHPEEFKNIYQEMRKALAEQGITQERFFGG